MLNVVPRVKNWLPVPSFYKVYVKPIEYRLISCNFVGIGLFSEGNEKKKPLLCDRNQFE